MGILDIASDTTPTPFILMSLRDQHHMHVEAISLLHPTRFLALQDQFS